MLIPLPNTGTIFEPNLQICGSLGVSVLFFRTEITSPLKTSYEDRLVCGYYVRSLHAGAGWRDGGNRCKQNSKLAPKP